SPQFIEPPINQSVTEGNSVNFSCRASGVPAPTLVWIFNNAELPSGINQTNHEGESFLEFLSYILNWKSYKAMMIKTINNGNTSLPLTSIFTKERATKPSLLRASQEYTPLSSFTTSVIANVLVLSSNRVSIFALSDGPPEINPELKNQSVTYNSPLQFKCSLSGFPTPEVLWTKDGMYLGKKNTLMIRQARFEDSGEYTCSAENLEGSMKSTFWIKVKGGTVLIHINEKEF
ncbi:hypothetical protein pdam_00023531, partial [Pocillopora damicornis]